MSTTTTLPTVEAYRAADVKGKAAIRTDLDRQLRSAVAGGDITAAQAVMARQAEIAASSPVRAKVEVDWFGTLSDRIATLRHAADLLESGTVTPDGFPSDWTRPEGPIGGTANVESASRIASAKVTRSADRADVAAGIQSAFADLDEGAFLTVAEITNKSGLPSGGAVAARLFPATGDCTVEGVTPVPATGDRPRGAVKG